MSKRTAVSALYWLAIALVIAEIGAAFVLQQRDLTNTVAVVALVVVGVRELLLRSANADDRRADAAGGGEQ
ncbi:hypothetical protein ABT043_32325 [Streptomyces sp. NPDC002418]|uniref:hypothetical protein n=1 Tax=Streptomyces sp. NPDC002418 TaxID=3156650 RepID=UPI0033244157